MTTAQGADAVILAGPEAALSLVGRAAIVRDLVE